MIDPMDPFINAGQGAWLVADFVQQAIAAVNRGGVDLPGDRQHRLATAIGGRQGGGGVQNTGAGNDREGANPAGRDGVAEGHIGGALLMAGVEDADGVALVIDGVEEMVQLHAGQGEQGIDAVA